MIYIASDHIGIELKSFLINALQKNGYKVNDLGPNTKDRVNYNDYAKLLCEKLKDASVNPTIGILICGTGIGMSMMANRYKKIRASVCTNEYMAEMTKKHNNANVLCLGSRVIGNELALSITIKFLSTDFEGGRHLKRILQLDFLND